MRKKIKKISKQKLKTGQTLNSEQTYLRDLIKDFPYRKKISVLRAEKLLVTRYRQLEKNISTILRILDDKELAEKLSKHFNKYPPGEDLLPRQFYFLIFLFHDYLFSRILSNAGQFRKSSDPYGGKIGFGGSDYRMIGDLKYSGSPCNQIENDLIACFSLLTKDSLDPVASSVEFYRRFVKIHPFYDANGRIGRLILSIYNLYHGIYVKWSEIESGGNKSELIKKLNECHKREGQYIYSTHFGFLVKFFRKFTIKVSDLSEEIQHIA